MKNLRKLTVLAILPLLSLLALIFAIPQPTQAQSGTPDEMHQAINALRAANGLAPLSVNSYLMQAAQYHANWIAAGNPGGHTGEGGSSSYDRAVAAGYGEGAQVWVTENWARGPGLTVSDCIYISWNDAAHMDNMLTTWHNEFGAGVALDTQGMTVYVVDFGHVSGTPAQPTLTPGDTTAPTSGPTATPSKPTATLVPLIQPVTKSTPKPDGAVIHIVQFGQSLWAIADAYDIAMADLLAQNNLTEDTPLQVDQELIIVPGNPEIAQVTTTSTLATEEEPTRTPSQTPTERLLPTPTRVMPTPTEESKPTGTFLANIFSGDTLWIGIGLIIVSVFGVALLLFTSSRLK